MKANKQPALPFNKAELEAALHPVFIYHAIDNRGVMASTHQADVVAGQIANAVFSFVQGKTGEAELTAVAADLGQQGLTVLTGTALMRVLGEIAPEADAAVTRRLNECQLLFLEKLAAARELEQQRVQEKSQTALQRALHTQLQQQISRHEAQERYNQTLNNILLLNTRLSQADDEKSLIDAAVSGICQALDLSSVTLYTISEMSQNWVIHTTTASQPQPGTEIEPDVLAQLQTVLAQEGEVVHFYQTETDEERLAVALPLRGGGRLLGALVANSHSVADVDRKAYIILLRAFSQNLAALWHNLHLRQETESRARELEILYGRYIDQLWQPGSATLSARLQNNKLTVERPAAPLPHSEEAATLPLQVGDQIFGHIALPGLENLADDERELVQAIVREIGNALNNARALQTAHAFSRQTSRLFETGRRISEAREETAVYRALVTFAQESELADLVMVLTPDPADPDFLVSPIVWNRVTGLQETDNRFSRDEYSFSEQLTGGELILLENGQTDGRLDETTRQWFTHFDYRAAALLPITAEGEWLATLALIRRAAKPFTNEALRPFQTVANQAGAILANHRLLHQTEKLYQIGRALTQTITRDGALDIAVREVARYTGARQCRFVLYDLPAGKGIVAAEAAGNALSRTIELPVLGDYVFARLNEERRPLLLTEQSRHVPAETIRRHVTRFGARASLFVPSASQQELLGFLAIDSHRGERPFTPSNVIFAQTVVDMLTTQLENIKLFDEALQRAQELITLNQIQSSIARILTMEKLAYVVYEQVGRLLDNTIFLLARYDTRATLYQPVLTIVEGEKVTLPERKLRPDEPLYQFLHQEQHLSLSSAAPLMQAEQIGKRPAQASLWVPMWQEDTPTGFITIQSYNARAYNENDIQLLRSIAIQTSLAMANTLLFEQIQQQNEELRELDKLKTQFLTNMSHELRTPLNSILGFSRVILRGIDGPVTPAQAEDLNAIFNNGHHLLNLINEILDMAKIEAGKMRLVLEPVNLAEISQHVHKTVEGLLDPEKTELVWQVPADLPVIEADPVRLRQILLNLLSNAVKYTESGQIRFSIQPAGEQIHIVVQDTGIGIAPENYERVFAPFEQVDSSNTRTTGGTGLGLPITKRLVEMHNGRLYFESELNKGTTFHLFLPVRQEERNGKDQIYASAPDEAPATGRAGSAHHSLQEPT